MYSFYGGKQGRSYKIVGHYDSIYDMVKAFQAGGSYTDVGYDEYVIIDTIFRKNQKNNAENGIIYRRGYDFNQKFYFTPPEGSEDSKPEVKTITLADKTTTTLKAVGYNITYQSSGQYDFGDNPLQKENVVIPKYYNYAYKFIENNGEIEVELYQTAFNQDAWNKDWNDFVEHPGGGAIYIGQIVGPEGDSPAVEMVNWDSFINHYEDNVELIKGQFAVNPKPGYDSSSASEDGYDQNGYHDTIQYGYCTIRDAQGQVTGAEIAFDIPYTVFEFEANSVSSYDTHYGTYDENNNIWTYQNLLEEQTDSLNHPYYKHYSISIPKGIHGQDVKSITISGTPANHNQYFVATYKNYDVDDDPESTISINIGKYKVINNIEAITNSNTYIMNENAGNTYQQPHKLRISYTNGDPSVFNYQTIEKIWYQSTNYDILQKGHVYIQLTTGIRVDCGILKQIEKIEKDDEDNTYSVTYNDGSSEPLSITDIAEIAFDGDLFLIRFNNPSSSLAEQHNYSYNNKNWINLGNFVKGNHIFGNFESLEALQLAYPYGFGLGTDGETIDVSTQDLKGWIATVGQNNTYTLYAYDYRQSGWYPIQELGANLMKPQRSILISKTNNLNPNVPNSEDASLLNEKGVWFVVTD